jgi:membrane peptidoglycan carboxypeptidase
VKRSRRVLWVGCGLLAGAGAAYVVADELQTSRWQSARLSEIVSDAGYAVAPGRSDAIRFPGDGPYDERLGYHALPEFIGRLEKQGYAVARQARMSPRLIELHDQGLFAPYREKTQAGLTVRDCRGEPLLQTLQPQRVYQRFEAVPPLLVEALLFVEDRHLLDAQPAQRNPAIDRERLALAVFQQARRAADASQSAPGGSTLATQIEKYRHSPHGRTGTAREKLRQMASASLRAYLDGADTSGRRRQILVDYLDSVPLAARPGFGEVHGIGDGMWAWYGRDFGELNRVLGDSGEGAAPSAEAVKRQAPVFKQALSLMIAQRRPSQHLLSDSRALKRLTDSYLRLMADAGVISPALRDAALPVTLRLLRDAPPAERPDFVQRKAASALRANLQAMLDVPRAYDLERLDLEVETSFDARAQAVATQALAALRTPAAAKAAGLYGFHLLGDGAGPGPLVFSLTLFERGDKANLLRVQADSVDQPFDVNQGARLDLGSTAKLRTLITYLEQVAKLHARWGDLAPDWLAALPASDRDPIATWAREYLLHARDRTLAAMLEAAMERKYSANPGEAFFTGGGLHHFANFEPEHNGSIMTVREGFKHSVNLVFIRLMRDVVRHEMFGDEVNGARPTEDPADPRRRELLVRFADREGSAFLVRFYRKYRGLAPADAKALLLSGVRPIVPRVASVLFGLDPQAGDEPMNDWLTQQPGGDPRARRDVRHLREQYGGLSLTDRAYVAKVHPLELWLVGYLQQHPGATLREVLDASRDERQQVYAWLFKTRHPHAQDVRIRELLELDAFTRIHRSWQRLGYPFESLTPSYASAIGASGDRPAALAELMGIIASNGARLPQQRIGALHFARATPYETHLEQREPAAQPLLPPELTATVRRALVGVVEGGTARRIAGALIGADGKPITVAGKTGTGDHRFEIIGRGGKLISERVVDRSATFMFTLGERYFGTVMVYVHEPDAARYKFTSALPVQILKSLGPQLLKTLETDRCEAPRPTTLVAREK